MNAVPHFSQSYVEARDKFLAAARTRGAKLMHHVHPTERGAEGEKLSMDFALVGKRKCQHSMNLPWRLQAARELALLCAAVPKITSMLVLLDLVALQF